MATNKDEALPNTTSEVMDVVQKTCRGLSENTTTNMVELANDKSSQKSLTSDIFPLYLYSWGLNNPEAVIIYLLLHCFILRRQCSDSQLARNDFETIIEKLKADLSAKASELQELQAATESRDAQTSQHSLETDRLTEQVKELKLQVTKLQANNDELCHINQQWALDYESLTQRVTPNTTGLHSTSSSIQRSASPLNCMECHSLRNQLEDAMREVRSLNFKTERMQGKMDRKDLEIDHLENENKAIQMQLQEVGDLHSAVKARDDLSTVQHQMAVLKTQYQDAVCQRLQYNKQVERLRQAFLQIFPFAAQMSRSDYTRERGYASYPARRPCRADQQYYSDPGPPTPPGLIARGDHHGSLVEKDVDPPPILVQRSEEQVTGFAPVNRWIGGEARVGLVPGTNAPHTWHGSDSHVTARSNTVVFHSEGHNGAIAKMDHGSEGSNTSPNGATLTGHDHAVNAAELAKKLESSQFNGRSRRNGEGSKLRPNTLSASWNKTGKSLSTNYEELKCPNCGRAFISDMYGFDDWFDHVKYCGS